MNWIWPMQLDCNLQWIRESPAPTVLPNPSIGRSGPNHYHREQDNRRGIFWRQTPSPGSRSPDSNGKQAPHALWLSNGNRTVHADIVLTSVCWTRPLVPTIARAIQQIRILSHSFLDENALGKTVNVQYACNNRRPTAGVSKRRETNSSCRYLSKQDTPSRRSVTWIECKSLSGCCLFWISWWRPATKYARTFSLAGHKEKHGQKLSGLTSTPQILTWYYGGMLCYQYAQARVTSQASAVS